MINRFFEGAETQGDLEQLERHLDQNVRVIDPRVTEERMEQYLASAKTPDEARRALDRHHEDRRRERRDMPLVEDFPLAPEEETPDFMHLAMTLQVQSIRAYEHWNGNTRLMLTEVIHKLVEQGAFVDPD